MYAASKRIRNMVSKQKTFKSKHVYEIVEIKPVEWIDSTKAEMKISVINVDTKSMITRKGFYLRATDQIRLSSLENVPNILIPNNILLNTPCEVVSNEDGVFYFKHVN